MTIRIFDSESSFKRLPKDSQTFRFNSSVPMLHEFGEANSLSAKLSNLKSINLVNDKSWTSDSEAETH